MLTLTANNLVKLDRRSTALLIIDVQNDYAHKDGYFSKVAGINVDEIREIVQPIRKLINKCKEHEVFVVWVQSTRTWDNCERNRHRILPPDWGKDWLGGPEEGSWGAEILDEIKPSAGDVVIQKHRNSAFYGTDLERILRNHGTTTLLFTGIATHGCVESTLRDAFFRDFDIILVPDCCADNTSNAQESTIRNVEHHYGAIAESQLLMAKLEAGL